MASPMVQCVKLRKEAPGIDADDIQGQVALDMIESVGGQELRQRVHQQVSMEAWELWKNHLTMLMNEHRLNMMEPQTDAFIRQQMEAFFFGEGAAPPPGYIPPRQGETRPQGD
ncbi:putative Fe(2+)-trafficking protein [Candidatus Entotheonellaceae bacterium PAL068K]